MKNRFKMILQRAAAPLLKPVHRLGSSVTLVKPVHRLTLVLALMMGSSVTLVAQAQTTPVTFPVSSMFGGAAYNKPITITAANTLISDGVNLWAGNYTILPASTTNIVQGLYPNTYLLTVQGVPNSARFTVPATTNTVDVTTLLTSGPLYYFGTNGMAQLLAGTNVTFSMNSTNGVVTINAAAGSLTGNVLTNGFTAWTNANQTAWLDSGGNLTAASLAGNGAGISNVQAATATTASNLAGTILAKNLNPNMAPIFNGSFLQPLNYFWDINNVTSAAPSMALTFGPCTTCGYGLWFSDGAGVGTNVFGRQVSFPGGFQYVGNPLWTDLPKRGLLGSDEYFSMGFGPSNSTFEAAFPNGNTQASVQPYYYFSSGNPFNGGAGINIRSAITNAAGHPNGAYFLQGTNRDGIPIYLPTWGFQLLQISEAYALPQPDCQDAGADVLLETDPLYDFYFAHNGVHLGGDTYAGQVPELILDTSSSNNAGHPLFRVPYQQRNIWMPRDAGWQDSMMIDEVSGAVNVTFSESAGNLSVKTNLTTSSLTVTNASTMGAVNAAGQLNAAGLFVTNTTTLYIANVSSQLSATNDVISYGGNAGFQFSDRTTPTINWTLYANNGNASLYLSGNQLSVSNNGDMRIVHAIIYGTNVCYPHMTNHVVTWTDAP